MQLVKKISVKTVFGNIDVRKLSDSPIAIMRIIGVATKIKSGESEFGQWTAFLGQFKATNLQTNEVFASGKCFLPPQASEILEGQFDDEHSRIEFAFDISAKYSEDSTVKYEYIVEPLFKPAENDPIALLESKL